MAVLLAILVVPAVASAEVARASTPEQPLTPAAAATIATERAEAMGRVEGKPAVTSSTVAAASAEVMGSEPAPDGPVAAGLSQAAGAAPAERVVLRGRFHDFGAKVPQGVEQPTGGLLELALNGEGRVVALHLGEPLSSVATATAARRRPRADAAGARRDRAHASVTSTWPCGDEFEKAGHCYAEARWKMENKEEVRGVEADIATVEMAVPEPSRYSFVDNEVWAAFPEKTNTYGPYWIESGQEAGVDGPNQMLWFWAYNNASGYHEGNPGWPEEGWVFHAYSLQGQGNSTWCVKIDGGSAGCVGGLGIYSKLLHAGGEYATPWQPLNNVYQQVNYTATGGEVRTWPRAEWFDSPTTCIQGFSRESPPHYYAGNIRYWVPC
jgi:hypothetical protein